MYQIIKSRVKHDGSFSQMFACEIGVRACEIGVRQGENLSPLLFSLFLNDLELHMISNSANGVELNFPDDTTWLKLLLLLYADNTVILSNDPTDFQNSLDIFNQHCIDWHLTVNANKTKVVIFASRQTNNYSFNSGNHLLDIEDTYHYLGVTFSSNGSFLKARKHVLTQANKAMHLLFTNINNSDWPLDLILKVLTLSCLYSPTAPRFLVLKTLKFWKGSIITF